MFGYRVPAADQALLISGWRCRQEDGTPFRVVTGHGAFVMPFFQTARFLTLAVQQATIAEPCATRSDITLLVRAVVEFKVANDPRSIITAARRFLADQQQMPVHAGRIFGGHLRSVIAPMTVEEILAQRQQMASAVLNRSLPEMAGLGLSVDLLQILAIEPADEAGTRHFVAIAKRYQAANRGYGKAGQAKAGPRAGQAQPDSEPPP